MPTKSPLRADPAVEERTREVLVGVAAIVEEITGIDWDEIAPGKTFIDDLDIDSVSKIEIGVEVEDRFDTKIPDEDLNRMTVVEDPVYYVVVMPYALRLAQAQPWERHMLLISEATMQFINELDDVERALGIRIKDGEDLRNLHTVRDFVWFLIDKMKSRKT